MFTIGQKVKVIGMPKDNLRNWGIPIDYVGKEGQITNITKKYITIYFDYISPSGWDSNIWNFPTNTKNVLELVILNKWNPLNYKSHFKPVKLP